MHLGGMMEVRVQSANMDCVREISIHKYALKETNSNYTKHLKNANRVIHSHTLLVM